MTGRESQLEDLSQKGIEAKERTVSILHKNSANFLQEQDSFSSTEPTFNVHSNKKRSKKYYRAVCDACKKVKKKCDGEQPCSRCERAKTGCKYAKKQMSSKIIAEQEIINLQDWLNTDHPSEERENIKNLEVNKKLEGFLDLSSFTNLEALSIEKSKIESLDIINLPKLREIVFWKNKKLTHLNLFNCPQLKKVECSSNHLTNLIITNCQEIISLDCSDNYLTNLGFLTDLNGKKLKELYIYNNDFSSNDLTPFSRFVNLEELYLGNDNEYTSDKEKITKGIYNHFCGTLEPLKSLTKLNTLTISNTDLEGGLEYLSENVEWLYYWMNVRKNAKVEAIYRLFANETGIVETENGNRWIKNFPQKLVIWRKSQPAYQLLEKTFQEINPNADINEFLRIINVPFFKIFDGSYNSRILEDDLNGIRRMFASKDEKRTSELLAEIQKLTQMTEKLKEKEAAARQHFSSEKELLQKLIKLFDINFKLIEAKKKRMPVSDHRKQFNKIREELAKKLGEELMEEVEIVLTDHEELINAKLELEKKLDGKLTIDFQSQPSSIIYDKNQTIIKFQGDNISVENRSSSFQGTERNLQEEVEQKRIEWLQTEKQQTSTLINQLIIQLRRKSALNPQVQEIINQAKDYLGAKRIFLNVRQMTVKGLQNCYNKLKGNKKYAKANEVGNLISMGGTVANSLTFGVPSALGETIKAINASFKRKFSDKCEEKFQQLLVNDKKELSILEDIIIDDKSLEEKSEKSRLFSAKYKIFEIDNSIWEGKPFSTPEEMEDAIILLSENWNNLEIELKDEESRLKEFLSSWEQSQQTPQILQQPLYGIPSPSKK
ncbi:MAG: hypothetical protein MRECE_51c006 [Mycoplasmataceae bacterium CE_OT135]|nr:MAG: hypothetical protein MRECE_51c006 [Mycoplasmataceae bacterium CE_OT135]